MKTRAPRLRILLVDDHALFRAGLRGLLERELGAQITAECASAEDALQAIKPPLPDIALLDISLRGSGDGIELARRIVNNFQGQVRCIMVSMHLSSQYVMRAFDAGVLGYVVKDAGPADLLNAVQAAMLGQRYMSPGASGELIDSLKRPDTAALHNILSPRQLEVLRMVACGKNTKLIARELGLSTKTVDSHRYQVSQRLGLHDVAGMVRYAIAHGLVDPAAV
jgi:DNA-binding NarL/FixJ family response regulator